MPSSDSSLRKSRKGHSFLHVEIQRNSVDSDSSDRPGLVRDDDYFSGSASSSPECVFAPTRGASFSGETRPHSQSFDGVSLPSTSGGLKGILKNRFRCESLDFAANVCEESDCNCYQEFLEAFRSVDDLFTCSSDGLRKRVSFSERVMKTMFRPGACILQQKAKAQRRKEKRAKERRRTASESDAGSVTSLSVEIEEKLQLRHQQDSDSGLENEPGYILEELPEAEEETEAGSDSAKKKRNRKKKKNRSRITITDDDKVAT